MVWFIVETFVACHTALSLIASPVCLCTVKGKNAPQNCGLSLNEVSWNLLYIPKMFIKQALVILFFHGLQ